jgi:anti-sigma regulatory factor (Ser/Thr protein kinase)
MAQHLNSILSDQQFVEVRHSSDVAEARRLATWFAGELDFDEVETANVSLVATELATNLVKHAKDGRILARSLNLGEDRGVELLALDQGPGIGDLARCLRDGYSTAGSSGTGLGAIKRLTQEFDIHSMPGKGTAVLARFWAGKPKPPDRTQMEFGAVCLPMPGQEVSGDGWGVERLNGKYTCTVTDGLGHGSDAAIAAHAALAMAKEHRDSSPAELVERAHGALRSTRGAALAVGQIDPARNMLRFCGVGNITATLFRNGEVRHLVSHNGIVGQEARKISEFTYPWSPESLLIMHSDGLTARWDLRVYPALVRRHPGLVAGVLYRDFNRGRDDATVLAAGSSNNAGLERYSC